MKVNLLFVLSMLLVINEVVAEEEIRWLKLRQELGLENIINAVFAPGDSTILVTDANLKVVEINANTGKLLRIVPIWGAYQFSDDKQFLYCNADGKVKWPSCELVQSYNKVTMPKYYDYAPPQSALNEKAGVLIMVGPNSLIPDEWQKDIYVYDLQTFQLIDTLGIYPSAVNAIEMTDDGKYFRTRASYVPNWDDPLKTENRTDWWDTKTLKPIPEEHSFKKISQQISTRFRVSPDNKWLCSVGGRSVKVFDNQTYELKYQWEVDKWQTSLVITSDSRYLISSGDEAGSMSVWDLKTGNLAYKYINGGGNVYAINKIGSQMLVYGYEGILNINNMLSPNTDVPESAEPVIYPNPSDGVVILNSKYFQAGQLNIEFYDMHGRLLGVLYDGFYKQEELKLDISYVNDGIFLIRTMQGKEFKTFKLIKGRGL